MSFKTIVYGDLKLHKQDLTYRILIAKARTCLAYKHKSNSKKIILTMATQAQIFDHILTTAMELNTEDLKAIQNICYRSYNFFNNITHDNISRLRNRHIVSLCTWREIINWKIYADATSTAYALIMKITCNTWER